MSRFLGIISLCIVALIANALLTSAAPVQNADDPSVVMGTCIAAAPVAPTATCPKGTCKIGRTCNNAFADGTWSDGSCDPGGEVECTLTTDNAYKNPVFQCKDIACPETSKPFDRKCSWENANTPGGDSGGVTVCE